MNLRFLLVLKKFVFVLILLFSFGFIFSQYYYFDTWSTSYPYQQWCNETLSVRINTQWDDIRWWRFHLILDPYSFYYSTSSVSSVLRSDLFNASTAVFSNWSSDWSPSWWNGWTIILQIDRTNTIDDYNWSNWLYWNIKFKPLYNVSEFYWSFGIEYISWLNTTETTLSRAWWVEMINPSEQVSRLTWTYFILQEPCVADTNNPSISLSVPSAWTKKSKLSWINLNLNENVWVAWSNVPYVWTSSHTVRTWNPWWTISNQYWINLNTFSLVISWNWNTKTFTWWSLWVNAIGNWRTWQDKDNNYSVSINSSEIFDYWIEKRIQITVNVDDNVWNSASTYSMNFNNPVWPSALGSFSPYNWAIFVNLSAPIQLWIQDDWAWVDSWSILVTLSWINLTDYWPYLFSGNDLNLSWVLWVANQPDYYINITNHPDFPTSWTIRVSVYAQDMENNIDTISDYTFTTRPDCWELQCCDYIYTQIWNQTPVFYPYADLYVNYSSWFVPTFTGWLNAWYLDCGETNYWISIYSWDGNTWSFIDVFTWTELFFSWTNIKAILTWDGNVILLTRIWRFVFKVYPSNRVTTFDNSWIVIFYDGSKNFVYSWTIWTDSLWTWSFVDEIPAWTYYVVYKWQSQLSSYISWFIVVQNSWLMLLDFTTWANLYWTQQKNLSEDDWFWYQTAWDLLNSQWVYDFMINGNDIAIIVWGLWWFPIDNWIWILDYRNLNWDVAINSSDIAIIWINFEMEDVSFYSDIWFQPLFNW